MLKDFLDFIDQNDLFDENQNILLAVSGGVDSVVMTELFAKSPFKFALAHCNFKLRGDASDADEVFVEKLAIKFNVSCYTKQFDTKEYANENGISTQMAARDLRYNWFNQLLDDNNLSKVATAHHINDSIETVLYNLSKGTGLKGFTGISLKNEKVIRPLLFCSRESIENYASEKQLEWREDISNQSDVYHRNLIRNQIVPLLKQINPSLENTFSNTLKRMNASEELLNSIKEDFINKSTACKGRDIIIPTEALTSINLAVLDAFLKPYGFNFSQVLNIKASLKSSGKVFESSKYILNVDRGEVIISPIESNENIIDNIVEGQEGYENRLFSFEINTRKNDSQISFQSNEANIDASSLEYPLIVRRWKEGDFFYPLGMKGKKKLSDFMIDNKIALNLKERVFVLVSDRKIVWVIGHRLDDRYKISSDTKKVLNIRLKEND